MGAPDFLTWDGNPDDGTLPYRPATDDMGGDHFEDDAEDTPDANENPTAAGYNQIVKQVAAQGKVIPAAKLEVRFSAGVPIIARASGPGNAVITSLFTPTDNGAGDTSVTWPADTFPPHQISPSGITVFHTSSTAYGVEEITNGIRVRTFTTDASGNRTAADLPWTICIN